MPSDSHAFPCSYADAVGYVLDGEPEGTALGQRYRLRRLDTPHAVPGSEDAPDIVIDLEMHSDYRLRVKVRLIAKRSLDNSTTG